MALGMGQMPTQSAPGQMSPMGAAAPRTSLGFPRLPASGQPAGNGPATQPMWAPGAVPNGTAAPAPTGVMPTNPAASATAPAPQQNVPVSVVGAPSPQPFSLPPSIGGIDRRGSGFGQHLQDSLTGMEQNNPGLFDRLQTVLGHNGGFGQNRNAGGFDWRSFINGLRPPAPAVGAAATPAPAAAPAPTAAPQTAPAVAPANGVIFNPLNLPGIGG